MIFEYILVQIHSSDSFFWVGFILHVKFIFKKNFIAPFYGWDSTTSRLQSHHKEELCFLQLSYHYLKFPKTFTANYFSVCIYQACQWMACDRACMHPHTPVFIYLCYHRTCKTLYDKLIACRHLSKCAQLSFCK